MDQATLQQLLSLTQFPQMTVNESAIARQWILGHASQFDSIEFNHRVGNTVHLGAGYEETTKRQAAIVSQKRLVILARSGSGGAVVEVKIRISLGALGQLLGYQLLWKQDHPETTAVHLVAIANDALVDAEAILQAYGVDLELYPGLTVTRLPYG